MTPGKQLGEQVILRIRVPAMLSERLGELVARLNRFGRARAIVPLDGIQVFIHAVMRPQPLSLAGVASEHAELEGMDFVREGDISRRLDCACLADRFLR